MVAAYAEAIIFGAYLNLDVKSSRRCFTNLLSHPARSGSRVAWGEMSKTRHIRTETEYAAAEYAAASFQ